jgi:predicted DNA-binding transcriptional regulator AlpA
MANRERKSNDAVDAREIGTTVAARRLKVSRATIYRYADSGDLPFRDVAPKRSLRGSKRRRTLRFKAADVEALIERQGDSAE